MSDHHGAEQNPNVAPTHQEIVADFSFVTVLIATLLGLVAAFGGIIFWIVLANDRLSEHIRALSTCLVAFKMHT